MIRGFGITTNLPQQNFFKSFYHTDETIRIRRFSTLYHDDGDH